MNIEMGMKSKKLFGAILLFVLLDLSVLVINFWMVRQISKDAVAINLSGRQRMLSQKMTKSLLQLQLQSQSSDEFRHSAIEEFRYSVQVFDQTLFSFKQGGMVVSGDGNQIEFDRVGSDRARDLVDRALKIWGPMRARMLPYMANSIAIPDEVINQARDQMILDNLQLLELMNRLTSDLEQDSQKRANTLRIAQTTVFVLALINFLVIVRRFHLLAQQSAKTSRHYNELAMRDPLTGLFNRRQFESNLEKEIAAVDRHQGSNVALVMIDLDGFKTLNDKHGHEAGDIALRTVATRLSESARVNDTVARIGGDEFVLICPDLHTMENADVFRQRLLVVLEQPISVEGGQISIGASIGIAFYPDHADSADDLFRIADQAMYAAKKKG